MKPKQLDAGVLGLMDYLDTKFPRSPGPRRTTTKGSWCLQSGCFHFTLVAHRSYAVLTDVWVPPNMRGQGHGDEGMKSLANVCDLTSVTLRIRPAAFDKYPAGKGIPNKDLPAFYAKYGFEEDRSNLTTTMVRFPRATRSA